MNTESKLITVIGATGIQGGSVIAAALKSGDWKIRGVTRNVNSDTSKALASKGVEMVTADWNDESTLVKAFEGSYAIYAVTDYWAGFMTQSVEELIDIEARQGISLAKAASQTSSLKHFVWSTVPDHVKISGGKHSIPHFEGKHKVDEFIRQDKDLLSKTTFLWVGYYGTNITLPMIVPNLLKTCGKYVQLFPVSDDTPITTVGDPKVNTGIYALAIFNQPQLTIGRIVLAQSETRTTREIINLWSQISGKPADYVQVPLDHYDNLWPKWGREIGLMLQFWETAREKSWTADEPVLTKEDLNISGLIGMKEIFSSLEWS